MLRNARDPSDLTRGGVAMVDGVPVHYRASDILAASAAVGERWPEMFEGIVEERGTPFTKADIDDVRRQARHAFEAAGIPDRPEFETLVRIAAEYIFLHSKGYEAGTGYKPKRNDGIDFNQLLVLALPGILCTSDRVLAEKVRAVGTAGSERAMSPGQLLATLEAGDGDTLRTLPSRGGTR